MLGGPAERNFKVGPVLKKEAVPVPDMLGVMSPNPMVVIVTKQK